MLYYSYIAALWAARSTSQKIIYDLMTKIIGAIYDKVMIKMLGGHPALLIMNFYHSFHALQQMHHDICRRTRLSV